MNLREKQLWKITYKIEAPFNEMQEVIYVSTHRGKVSIAENLAIAIIDEKYMNGEWSFSGIVKTEHLGEVFEEVYTSS